MARGWESSSRPQILPVHIRTNLLDRHHTVRLPINADCKLSTSTLTSAASVVSNEAQIVESGTAAVRKTFSRFITAQGTQIVFEFHARNDIQMDTIKQHPNGYLPNGYLPNGDLPKGYLAGLILAMKPHDIRRANLLKLIDERFEGNKGRFADTVGRKRPLIYRLFSDAEGSRRDIGEELARDIEHKLGLKPGWLDLDGAATAEPVSGAYAVNIPPALAPLVQDLCRAFNSKSLTPAVVSSFRNMVQALNAQTQDIATSAEADAKTIKLGKKLSAKAINLPPDSSDTDKTSDLDSN